MTDYATADDLTEGPLDVPEADLTLSTGKTIRLRGLSRAQLFFNGKVAGEDSAKIEALNLVSCLVRPVMTNEQATRFLARMSAGDGGKVSQKIRELSGLDEGADKSPVAEVRD